MSKTGSARLLAILTLCCGFAVASTPAPAPKPFPAEAKWIATPDWGPGSDASPAFTPDGKTVFFTHANGARRTIMVSHLTNGQWSEPKVATFSGTWRDIEPAMAPDGSYMLFISNRPSVDGGQPLDGHYGGVARPAAGGNVWRLDKVGDEWGKPVGLSGTVNSNSSVYAPTVARNGNIYFMQPDPKTDKFRLYRSQLTGTTFATPEPLPFSDGVISDFDPVVAPDESFIIFGSGRPPIPEKQSGLFVAFSERGKWKTPVPFKPFLNGLEARLSPDLKTLYFTADTPILETTPAAQNTSANLASVIPQRIWQVPLKSWRPGV